MNDRGEYEEFVNRAHAWLSHAYPQRGADEPREDDVAIFHSLPFYEERKLITAAATWQQTKMKAGYGAIDWPVEFGGAGLTPEHARLFTAIEDRYRTPADHELRRITTNLVAPTLHRFGSRNQRKDLIADVLHCRRMVCQLFSEPSAGSDLASLATKAVQYPDGSWLINGSKVWVSGAQFADWGLLIARSNPDVPKHAGLTAFLVPMNLEGIEIRPIRQMSGGTSFNEVFFTDTRIGDEWRVGDIGQGWAVTLAMLSFERNQSGSKTGVGGSVQQLLALAHTRGHRPNPAVRRQLVDVYIHERLRAITRNRADLARRSGREVGPEGSLGKLLWAQGLTKIGDAAALLLGPNVVADVGTIGEYAWAAHVLGAPGYHIAGGSDEIQHNIIGERVLGLPSEPRRDIDVAWRDLSR